MQLPELASVLQVHKGDVRLDAGESNLKDGNDKWNLVAAQVIEDYASIPLRVLPSGGRSTGESSLL